MRARAASSSIGAIRVDEIDHRGAFAALAEAWPAAQSPSLPGPFGGPEWFAVTAAHLARAPRKLRLLAAHRGPELVGALPLLVEDRRLAGAPARVYRSLSDDHSQRFDLLATGEDGVRALWQALAADERWDVLELRDVTVGSTRAGLLHALAAEAGFPTTTWASQRSPWMPIPSTEKLLEKQLDAKFRGNLRRRARHLARLGEVTLERITSDKDGDIDAALDEGFALERSGWKGDRGTAIACDGDLAQRYRALAHAFARRGTLSLHFLRVAGRRVAFHFAVEEGGVYYLFKPGYDQELARYGLGHLLTWEVARGLVTRGVRELDFLGDDLPWKREWTEARRDHRWLYVFRPSLRGRALHLWKTRAVPALKRARDHLQSLRHRDSDGAAPVSEEE